MKFINKYFWICLIIFTLGLNTLQAQEEITREYSPEEYISLNRDLGLDAALEIINQFSTKYENKIIIDSKERKGKIPKVSDSHRTEAQEVLANREVGVIW